MTHTITTMNCLRVSSVNMSVFSVSPNSLTCSYMRAVWWQKHITEVYGWKFNQQVLFNVYIFIKTFTCNDACRCTFTMSPPGNRPHSVSFAPPLKFCLVKSYSQILKIEKKVLLVSWTTLLVILLIPLSEILRAAPVCGCFIAKLCSLHSWIMAPTVLTGTLSGLEILL